MANEITITINKSVLNGNYDSPRIGKQDTYDQTTLGGHAPGTVTVGTTVEQISFGDIVPGPVYFENLDGTNHVHWGFGSGSLGGYLPATANSLVWLTTGSELWMRADGGNVKVLIDGDNA